MKGHSYLPPDRVFGRIEKDLRHKPVIKSPAEYQEVFERYGNVYVFGDDFFVYDYKTLSDKVLITNKSKMEMSKNRVWIFHQKKPDVVFVSNLYHSDLFTPVPVVKKSIPDLSTRKPKLLQSVSHVSVAKKADIEKLLKVVPLTEAKKAFYAHELGKKCLLKDSAEHPKPSKKL